MASDNPAMIKALADLETMMAGKATAKSAFDADPRNQRLRQILDANANSITEGGHGGFDQITAYRGTLREAKRNMAESLFQSRASATIKGKRIWLNRAAFARRRAIELSAPEYAMPFAIAAE